MDDEDFVAASGKLRHMLREVANHRGIFQQSAREFDDNSHRSPVCSSIPSVRLRF